MIGLHFNAFLIGIQVADNLHPLFCRRHIRLMHIVADHTDDQPVEQR